MNFLPLGRTGRGHQRAQRIEDLHICVDPDGQAPAPKEWNIGGGGRGFELGARMGDGSPVRNSIESSRAALGEARSRLSGEASKEAQKVAPALDKAGNEIGRISVDSKGNAMIEPVGGRTVPAGKGGVDTHTLYPNGSNYHRLNPQGHGNNPTPHGHGHALGTGSGVKGQGPSLDVQGNTVPSNSAAAHWPID